MTAPIKQACRLGPVSRPVVTVRLDGGAFGREGALVDENLWREKAYALSTMKVVRDVHLGNNMSQCDGSLVDPYRKAHAYGNFYKGIHRLLVANKFA